MPTTVVRASLPAQNKGQITGQRRPVYLRESALPLAPHPECGHRMNNATGGIAALNHRLPSVNPPGSNGSLPKFLETRNAQLQFIAGVNVTECMRDGLVASGACVAPSSATTICTKPLEAYENAKIDTLYHDTQCAEYRDSNGVVYTNDNAICNDRVYEGSTS